MPAAVGVREPVEDLARRVDRLRIGQLPRAQRLAQRPAADVLVGDVDVARVGAEAVRAQAALVAKPCRRLGLALGPVAGLAFSRHDLEGHVETVRLVAREPDGARRAAPERPQWPIAVEHELARGEGVRCDRHVVRGLATAAQSPLRSGAVATVSRDPISASAAVTMSEREPDFEFDFFEEESQTREGQPTDGGRERSFRRPLGGPRGPKRPPLRPATGFAPLLRLIGLIAFAILIVVVLVLWVQSCREDQRRDTYRNYVNDVGAVARSSEAVGRRLNDVLTTQAIQPAELDQQLTALVQQQTLAVEQAKSLDPPGPLRAAHQDMVQALEFRVAGLDGIAESFRRTRGTDDAQTAGGLLVSQAQRLTTSDVVWDDLFVTPAKAVLADEDVTAVEVPDSNFVQTPDLASRRTMVPIWQRINGKPTTGGGTGAGLHGTAIDSVTVLPANEELVLGQENTIVASTDLAFRVDVENTGDNQEVEIEVTLTIQQTPTPVTKTQKIDIINPGEIKSVTFRDFPSIDFGEPRQLRVDVAPVPDEARTDNNSREYQVIFSFE